MRWELPADATLLQWHRAPGRAKYRSSDTAERACRWLNTHTGAHDEWVFRPGGSDGDRWYLDRRWVGESLGLLDILEAGPPNPPSWDPPPS